MAPIYRNLNNLPDFFVKTLTFIPLGKYFITLSEMYAILDGNRITEVIDAKRLSTEGFDV